MEQSRKESAKSRATRKYNERQGLTVKSFKIKKTDAEAFKTACTQNGENQATVITRLMKSYAAGSLGETQATKELERLTTLCAEQQRQLEEMKKQLEATARIADPKSKSRPKTPKQKESKLELAKKFISEYPDKSYSEILEIANGAFGKTTLSQAKNEIAAATATENKKEISD